MKKYLLIAGLMGLLFVSGKVAGQSAVFVCEKTGKWGSQSDDGKEPRATMNEVKGAALKMCKESGGEDCRLFFSSVSKGYYCFISGNSRDQFVFTIGISQESEKAARKNAMDNYLKQGGIVGIGVEISTWHCPKNAIDKH